jgi:hypothetical protein
MRLYFLSLEVICRLLDESMHYSLITHLRIFIAVMMNARGRVESTEVFKGVLFIEQFYFTHFELMRWMFACIRWRCVVSMQLVHKSSAKYFATETTATI